MTAKRNTTNLIGPALTILLAAALFAVAGCGGGDDTNPGAPSGNDTMVLDSDTAQQFTLEALGVLNEMIGTVPDFAVGDFGGWVMAKSSLDDSLPAKAASDSVSWDPTQDAWVFLYDGPLLELPSPSYWNLTLDLWVQYRNGQTPQQYPLGADVMELHYLTGMDMHMVEETQTTDLTYDLATELVVSYRPDGRYGVVGSGSTVVDVAQVSDATAEAGRFAVNWSADVTTGAGLCPSGTASVTTQVWQMLADYDGLGGVSWTLTGPGYSASGTDIVACGQDAP